MVKQASMPYAYRRDVPFDLTLNAYGDLQMLEDSDAVNQSIYNILLSNDFDIPMAGRNWGNLERMIFEPGYPAQIMEYEIKSRIQSALENKEPSIEIIDINVDLSNINKYSIRITIQYALNDGVTTGIFDEDLAFTKIIR